MTRFAPIALALIVVFAGLSTSAKADIIGLYGDDMHTTCSAQTMGSFALQFYVFHYSATGTTGSRFMTPLPSCFVDVTGPVTNSVFPSTIGTAASGVEVYYGECLTGWIHVLDIVYFSTFEFPPCCIQTMAAHPTALSGYVEVIPCSGGPLPIFGYSGISEADSSCPCELTVGTESATWGSIKALYVSE
jgi:hypothetical protein